MSDRLKLLVLTSSYPSDSKDGRAAAGFFVKDFVNELTTNCNVTVLTQHTGRGPREFRSNQHSVVLFPWYGEGRPLSTLRLPQDILSILSIMISGLIATIRQVRKKRVDHVIALWAIPCGIWALVLKKIFGIPYSVWCLGADVWDYQTSVLTRYILKLVLSHADKVYADGYELCDNVNAIAKVGCFYLPSSRYFATPANPVSLEPEGVRHYLFVGRYHYNKGPDILIHAINILPAEIRHKIHCHFYGGGPLQDELEQLISSMDLNNTVTLNEFIGATKLEEVLYATDTVVIPSRKDTISLMIPAALQMKKAIIAANVGDMGYVLNKFNVGCVVSANSPESIAEGIQRDLSSPDTNRGERSDLLEMLDIANAAAKMIDDIVSSGPD